MRHIGRYHMHHAFGKEKLLSIYVHSQASLEYMSDLFMKMVVLFQHASLFYFPECERAFFTMNHFAKKTGPDSLCLNFIEMLHKKIEVKRYY